MAEKFTATRIQEEIHMEDMRMQEIEQALDLYVRPVLAAHDGNIIAKELDGDVLYFKLTGMCSGCAAADLTSESLVNEELTKHVSWLKQAVLDTSVSDDLLAQAKAILNKTWTP